MKTKLITLIMLLVVSLTAIAQKKVAVYVTGQETGINKVLGDKLVAAFAKSGKYIAVERTASFLTELSNEQSYQRSGAVSDREIASLGVQFGVQYVCVADVSDVFGEKYVSARLIDVETAEVVNTHNIGSQINNLDKCIEIANEIAENLTKGSYAEQAAQEKAKKEAKLKAQRDKEEMERRRAEMYLLNEKNNPGYIDLGLPSGTMWKKENEGGKYSCEEAYNAFGNQLPSAEQVNELLKYCTPIKESNGYKFIGPNGHYIKL